MNRTFAILILSFCSLMLIVNTAQAMETSLEYNQGQQKIENNKIQLETSIDELLGPKQTFPFLPDEPR